MAASTHLRTLVGPDVIDRVGAATDHDEALLDTPRTFDDVYRNGFAFVWRSARRLGVGEAALDDVVQEVFMIVHRRWGDFEGRSTIRTWLFGITLRVARDHRRAAARKSPAESAIDPDSLRATAPGPGDSTERAEALLLLHAILDEMDEERRAVFILAELEQMTMPEIAGALGLNVNTAHARLRTARIAFEAALTRHRARDEWRLK